MGGDPRARNDFTSLAEEKEKTQKVREARLDQKVLALVSTFKEELQRRRVVRCSSHFEHTGYAQDRKQRQRGGDRCLKECWPHHQGRWVECSRHGLC